MKPANTIRLEFDPTRNRLDKGKALSAGLSAVARIGDTLWVANDETISLERLTLTPAGDTAGDHRQFSLADYLRLPVPLPADPKALEEVDVEGLDYADGYLWLVGSHSLKRKQPKAGDSARQSRKRLGTVEGDGNRYLIARIPVEDIRDLCVSGADLLVLAGPSMDLDGPVAIFRWPGGAKPDDASIVPADQLERLVDVP
jgi:hypothetical protein